MTPAAEHEAMRRQAAAARAYAAVPEAAKDRLAAALDDAEAFYATRFPVLCALIERELFGAGPAPEAEGEAA